MNVLDLVAGLRPYMNAPQLPQYPLIIATLCLNWKLGTTVGETHLLLGTGLTLVLKDKSYRVGKAVIPNEAHFNTYMGGDNEHTPFQQPKYCIAAH